MAKTPKPPSGCRIKNGRYYRVQYTGIVDGKRKQKWHPLSRVSDGLPALYTALAELSPPVRPQTSITETVNHAWLNDRYFELGPVGWLKENWSLFHFSRDDIIANASPYDVSSDIETACGIYFLIDSGRIVYVGQSIAVGSRLAAHLADGKKFDSVFSFETSQPLLDWIESQYINTLKPELNKAIPKWLLVLP